MFARILSIIFLLLPALFSFHLNLFFLSFISFPFFPLFDLYLLGLKSSSISADPLLSIHIQVQGVTILIGFPLEWSAGGRLLLLVFTDLFS